MHFTYEKLEGCLKQGDVLKINDDLKGIFEEFHPYFVKNIDNKFFIVLTQSCDLKIRDTGKCSSRYITLAVVRSAKKAFHRALKEYQRHGIEEVGKLCSDKMKGYYKSFIIRLLNNNETDYFFLAKDASYKIYSDHVAFLKLSVPIKSNEHYDKCITARIASLKDIFRAKLGWLTGNIYSRVGTPDWIGDKFTKREFDQRVDGLLDSICVWLDPKTIDFIASEEKKMQKELNDNSFRFSKEQIKKKLEEFDSKKISRREEFTKEIIKIVTDIEPTIAPNKIQKIENRIKNDANISAYIR